MKSVKFTSQQCSWCFKYFDRRGLVISNCPKEKDGTISRNILFKMDDIGRNKFLFAIT